jgi:ligand-binding sensor domain-containing protein
VRREGARRWGKGPRSPLAWASHRAALFGIMGWASAMLLVFPAGAHAERLRFSSLRVEDGLSDSWVRSVLKDHRGFMWFGTRDGLSRYDGYHFKVYRHDPNRTHSLSSSDIWVLLEDSRQRLWIGGPGLDLYDRDHDRFESALAGAAGSAAKSLGIRAMCEGRPGKIWLGTQDGLVRFDAETRSTIAYRHDPRNDHSLRPGAVMGLAYDHRGVLWIGTATGVDRLDEDGTTFTHILGSPSGPPQPASMMVREIYLHPDGGVWVASLRQGLLRIAPETGDVRRYRTDGRDSASLGGDRIMTVLGDGGTTIYAGGEHGLHILDTRTGRFRHSAPDPDDLSSLTSASIWSLFLDDQSILWIGTFNGGVNLLSAHGQRFGLVRAGHEGLGDSHVLAVLEDHAGSLWVGTDGGGLDRLDRRTGRIRHYRHDPAQTTGLSSDSVLALAEDAQHQIWIGTWTGGLLRLDPRLGRFTSVPVGTDGGGGNITAVKEDSHGDILVGTSFRGVYRLDRSTAASVPLAQVYPGVTTGAVSAVVEDRRGDLWIGLGDPDAGGVDHISRGTGRVARLRHAPGDPDSLSAGGVTTIHPDSQGNVWIGTDYGGLNVIESGTGRMRHYTTADGLPTNTIALVLEDQKGGIWISTSRGLVWLEDGVRIPASPRFQIFDVHDGLQGNEFRHGAGCAGATGELFFGGQRGLTYFRPGAIRRNPRVPPVVLTDLRIFNKPVPIDAPGSPLSRAVTEMPALTLSYRQSVVTFEFAALDFLAPQKNRYAYKLDGFDRGWNEVGTQRTAPYTNLPPGDFVLRVRASNNDGVWNEEGIALPIHITPPFWRTRWFSAAAAIFLLGAIGVAYRLRVRHHLRVAQELRARVEEATAQIKTLHGLLPMCSWCKKVRDDHGYWSQIEEYVRERTEADFSHGICPDCRARYFPGHRDPAAEQRDTRSGDPS